MAAKAKKSKTKFVKSFTIKRGEWLPSELTQRRSSYLRGPGDDGNLRMCCLGVYLHACGISKAALLYRTMPMSVAHRLDHPKLEALLLKDEAGGGCNDSKFADTAATTNDDASLSLAQREAKIIKRFAAAGIKVRFTGSLLSKRKAQELGLEALV